MSNTFADFFFGVFTFVGDEIFFIFVAMFVFWCINKREGFRLLNVYFIGCAVVNLLKTVIRRPRPFLEYPDYVRPIGGEASGYSLPSGHSHSVANLSTQIIYGRRGKKLNIFLPVCIAASILVMFTRLYLGQHYLTDVLLGAVVGVVIAIVLVYLFELLGKREEFLLFGIIPVCIFVTVFTLIFNDDLVEVSRVLTVTGAYTAIVIGYFFEKRYVKLETNAVWWKQILKLVIGGTGVFLIKEGVKLACSMEQCVLVYAFARYFFIGAWASIGAPLLFKILKLYQIA